MAMSEQEKKSLLRIAAGWVGYLEKHTRDYSAYDKKGTGAGLNNWTRFGRLADIVLYGRDRRVKDGYSWCAMFLLACLYELKAGNQDCRVAAGTMPVNESARRWVREVVNEGRPIDYFAGCSAWLSAYRHRYAAGKEPHVGDFVVYLDKAGRAYHIGVVEVVLMDGRFVTIEGNTSATGDNIVPNGGAVARKKRKNANCVFLYN